MSYLSIFIVGLTLVFLDLSLLPYFIPGGFTLYLSIAFIVALSLKYSGLATLPLAFIIGLLYDWAAIDSNGLFTYLLVIIFVIGKILHYQKTNFQSGFRLTIFGLLTVSTIYLVGLGFVASQDWLNWENYLIISLISLIVMSVNLYIMDKFVFQYFNWLEKSYQNRRKS